MMKMKHIFGLFAMMVMLVLSSCQKLDDLEPGSDALLPTRAVYSDDTEADNERPSLKGDTRAGEDLEDDDDDVDNVNDDDDEEEDDEEQSLNGLPQ